MMIEKRNTFIEDVDLNEATSDMEKTIYGKLNQDVNEIPEDHYERFVHIVNNAREKHLESKIVKYHKKKT